MGAMEEALLHLVQLHGSVTSQIIKDLIVEHAPKRQQMIKQYERYKASKEGPPIFRREFKDKDKVNNKLNNAFDAEIVDTKVGYFAGHPVSYVVEEEATARLKNATVEEFNTRNNIEDLDSETVKMMTICGHGTRLLYIDKQGKERIMNVKPWEVIFVTDRSINEPQFALRYYDITVQEGNTKTKRKRVEWYDEENVTFYLEESRGEYVLDSTETLNPRPHMFDGVPLIGFLNNEERQGDAEKVYELIDGYDRSLSDVNSEIESMRLAYLVQKGLMSDPNDKERIKQTGIFELMNPESDVYFVTKDLNDTIIENHLNRLEQNILRFAKSVNFGDEQFAGNIAGVALKFKLMSLENKCVTAELKMKAGLRQQYKLLCSAWEKKSLAAIDDYLKIGFVFTRNLPANIQEEATTTGALKGMVSEETRLGLLSFVKDPKAELEKMQQEALEAVDLDGVNEEDNDVRGGDLNEDG